MKRLALLALLPCLALAQEAGPPAGFYPPPPLVPRALEGACPDCGGSGKADSKYGSGITDSRGERERLRVPCRRCQSTGRCVRPAPLAERHALQQRLLVAYDREHRAARRMPVGAGFMEAKAEAALSPEARADLAARFPKRCDRCLGLGEDECRKCDGTGVRVVSEERRTCEGCGGSGALPCRKCKGSGLAKVCSRCDGRGTVEVKARREIPAHTARCRSCDGDGRR